MHEPYTLHSQSTCPTGSKYPAFKLGGAISGDTGGAGIPVDRCARGDPLGEGCYKNQRLEYLLSKSIASGVGFAAAGTTVTDPFMTK